MPLKKASKTQIGEPAAPWFVSYSDLVTQLLIFFVMLFALSAATTEDQLKRIKRTIDAYVKEHNLEKFVSTEITLKKRVNSFNKREIYV